MNIEILSKTKRTQKRSSGCDVVKVTAMAKDILNELKVKVLSNSKRDTKTYSVLDIAVCTWLATFVADSCWPNTDVYDILNNLKANVLSQSKRAGAEGPHPSVGSEDVSAAKEVAASKCAF
jgi:hypothetical protein